MSTRFRSIIVLIGGVFCFCSGVWLRFHAVEVGTSALRANNNLWTDMNATNIAVANAARANAFYDVAIPLLWVGGVLVVAAAVILLIPTWQSRSVNSLQPVASPSA